MRTLQLHNNRNVLITWVARSNDPYEWDSRKGEHAEDIDGKKISGPTLALLFHPESFLCDQITDVITFCRKSTKIEKLKNATDITVAKELKEIIETKSCNRIRIHTPIIWENDDPTDHESLFHFMKRKLPEVRIEFPRAEIYLHLSPGTPQMHAIMLLMATSGFVTPALKMVKTYRSSDGKKGRDRFQEVRLDISPFYESYRNARPQLFNSSVPGGNLPPEDFDSSGKMRKIYGTASTEAKKRSPVLIIGEIGTGKYALASWIRLRSTYCKEENNSSWPAISCGAHRSIDSFYQVLYGDKSKGYQGILSSASGETLLLDDIDQLSQEAQKLLVQLLDRSEFRLIATTCLSKKDALASLIIPLSKRFSSALLELPPIRNVKEDMVVFWVCIFENEVLNYLDEYQQKRIILWEKENRSKIVASLKKCTLNGNLHDIKKIAINIVTSLTSDSKQQEASMIISQAILDQASEKSAIITDANISKIIARAFANNKPLDDYLPIGELVAASRKLEIKGFEKDLKKYIADEITRLAVELKCGKEALCHIDRKTIHEWSVLAKGNEGKNSYT